MIDLLNFMLKGLLGDEDFSVSENESEGRTVYSIKTKPENIGLVIGKGGKTIHALRNLLKVRATLEKKAVGLEVTE